MAIEVTAEMVKELRGKTGCGIMDCKAALKECEGDLEKSVDYLRKKGLAAAQKRAGRATAEGLVHSYIHHGGKIGVLLEVNCETDFVAKSEPFMELVNNISMHIAASAPAGLAQEDIPAELIEREREIYKAQALESGKPENMLDKIVDGKMSKFFKDNCLLTQPYVREPKTTIQDLLTDAVAKMGENIQIRRFARFQLGE